jgi:hypothetical protein
MLSYTWAARLDVFVSLEVLRTVIMKVIISEAV